MGFRDDLLRVVEPYASLRLVFGMSVYLSRSGSRSRLRFIPSGVNEAAFELHAQLPHNGSISRSCGARC